MIDKLIMIYQSITIDITSKIGIEFLKNGNMSYLLSIRDIYYIVR